MHRWAEEDSEAYGEDVAGTKGCLYRCFIWMFGAVFLVSEGEGWWRVRLYWSQPANILSVRGHHENAYMGKGG